MTPLTAGTIWLSRHYRCYHHHYQLLPLQSEPKEWWFSMFSKKYFCVKKYLNCFHCRAVASSSSAGSSRGQDVEAEEVCHHLHPHWAGQAAQGLLLQARAQGKIQICWRHHYVVINNHLLWAGGHWLLGLNCFL